MPNMRAVPLVALLALPVAAQSPSPPADSTLAGITARGRQLLQYDIAAWHGGDAVMALQPKPGEITVSFARLVADNKWEVSYGRLNETKDAFLVTYRAVQTDADSAFTATHLAVPIAERFGYVLRARSIETALQDFGTTTRPYNSYVLPDLKGGFYVYLLPAQTSPRSFPLGGDVRYRIVNGTTIVEKVRFHNAILDRPMPTPAGGDKLVAMMHTSFDSLPSESDVFVVLRRFPKLPEFVATAHFNYQIAVDGTITWAPAGAIVATAPPASTAAAHIPVWKVKVDTVGSAPRIMSPGYTEWRDSTTGWRLALERTVEIKGADSGSYNGSWRVLALADGRVLVSRARPAAIHLYDSEGRFVREIGHDGTGTEEFMSQPTLAMKGDTLIAFDGIQSRMMLFALDGRFIRSFQVAVRGSPIPIAVDRRGYVRVQQRYGLFGDTLSRLQWVYYTMRGVPADSITRPPLPDMKQWAVLDGTRNMNFQVPLSAGVGDAFLPDGTLIYGVGNRFELFATRTGRDTARIFGRSDVAAIPVPATFVDTTIDELTRAQPLLKAVAKRSDIPANYPLWNAIAVDDKGYLWMSLGVRGRTPTSFNVFAPEGRFLGALPSWFDRVDQASFAGDHIAYVGFDKDRRAVLRIYKIDRRGM
jgi:hypothetical protein